MVIMEGCDEDGGKEVGIDIFGVAQKAKALLGVYTAMVSRWRPIAVKLLDQFNFKYRHIHVHFVHRT
jgi:hypothetical protein